jgi:hypothetical protein
MDIIFVQQLNDSGQICAQGLLQGFEQAQYPIGVPDEFHGPFNGQIDGGGRRAHTGWMKFYGLNGRYKMKRLRSVF